MHLTAIQFFEKKLIRLFLVRLLLNYNIKAGAIKNDPNS